MRRAGDSRELFGLRKERTEFDCRAADLRFEQFSQKTASSASSETIPSLATTRRAIALCARRDSSLPWMSKSPDIVRRSAGRCGCQVGPAQSGATDRRRRPFAPAVRRPDSCSARGANEMPRRPRANDVNDSLIRSMIRRSKNVAMTSMIRCFNRCTNHQSSIVQILQAWTNASNSVRNSPVLQKFSGCHCTPRQKRRFGSSMASITPSGAVADAMSPSPRSFGAW